MALEGSIIPIIEDMFKEGLALNGMAPGEDTSLHATTADEADFGAARRWFLSPNRVPPRRWQPGGIGLVPSCRKNGRPSVSEKRNAPARIVIDEQQAVDFAQDACRLALALRRSMRRISALPHRSGAESRIAPNISVPAPV